MKKVFIIHGFQGRPNLNWFPWLMGELAKNDIYACAIPMPSPDMPVKTDWITAIKEAVKNPTEEVFLVGHSLGVPAILRYLESLDTDYKIGGVVLVSGPLLKIEKEGYEQVNTFLDTTFDFDHIKNVCKNFTVIHGDNDTAVPLSDGVELSKKLVCDFIIIPNGGHLNGSASCFVLPSALESLLKMANSLGATHFRK
ncbi:MAG: alpha/beta hydrolase [Candidatus Nomurabacteria bacterium]|nr:alpha/beta hydrolase [Candidatus Nomurabacteria bacterium]